jgi:hypothetical protein
MLDYMGSLLMVPQIRTDTVGLSSFLLFSPRLAKSDAVSLAFRTLSGLLIMKEYESTCRRC